MRYLPFVKRLIPPSAKGRLVVIFMTSTTLLMVLFGAGSYYSTHQQLVKQNDAFKAQLAKHLVQPVVNALWIYDFASLDDLLDTELGNSVLSLAVYSADGKRMAKRLDKAQTEASLVQADVGVFNLELPSRGDVSLGRIEVTWSDQRLRTTLNQSFWLTIGQILGVNLVLLLTFWFGVDRIIFRRIAVLQHALNAAVRCENTADIVPLPVTLRDEFGAITQSINAITARLGAELEMGRESEEEARAALTSLQNAQEGLVQAEKMASLGRLVAGVSHELNTPIGNLVMAASSQQELAQQLDQAIAGGALTRSALTNFARQSHEVATLMLQSASRAAALIQNFKQVAVDQTTDQLREFDLAAQTGEVLAVISHMLAKTPIKLVRDLEPGIVMSSYPGPLGQVVTNLVMNAIKHGFDEGQLPGQITVACKRQGERACITVQDNGCGIAKEHIGKIFDPFFTTKLGQGGSGLGLNISHNIVFGPLGGRLLVESQVGVGTTFTLLLPFRVSVPG
jgi:two-component system NtrC family sensor kinase